MTDFLSALGIINCEHVESLILVKEYAFKI
jgi:hypothetical protein